MIGKIFSVFKQVPPEQDPVCSMLVDPKKPAGGTFRYQGTTYVFCGPGCQVAFSKDPEAYLSGEKHIDM